MAAFESIKVDYSHSACLRQTLIGKAINGWNKDLSMMKPNGWPFDCHMSIDFEYFPAISELLLDQNLS